MSTSPYRQRTGTVRNWNTERGFGFIRPTEGKPDIFVHFSDVVGTHPEGLRHGQRVAFDVKDTDLKSQRAVSVILVNAYESTPNDRSAA